MKLYGDLQASLFKFCSDFIAEQSVSANLQVIKWDAHADLTELPTVDLIGPAQFSVEVENGLHTITTMFMVSTWEDTNLFRMDEMLDELFYRLGPNRTIPLIIASSGTQRGLLKMMEGTAVLPVESTKTRPLKAIACRMGTDAPQAP